MVQILPGKKPDAVSSLIGGALGAAPEALGALTSQIEKDNIMKARESYYDKLGLDKNLAYAPENIQTATLQKKLASQNETFENKISRLTAPGDQSDEFEDYQKQQTDNVIDKYENLTPEEKLNVEKTHPKEVKSIKQMIAERDKKQKEEEKKKKEAEKLSPEELYKRKLEIAEEVKSKKEAQKNLINIEGNLDTLNRLESLSEKTRGLQGYNPLNPSVKEFNALGFAAIEPILKVFNPVGPIPVGKVKIIEERFAPQARDTYAQQQGKIRALRQLMKRSKNNQERIITLYDQFDGKIPNKIFPPI